MEACRKENEVRSWCFPLTLMFETLHWKSKLGVFWVVFVVQFLELLVGLVIKREGRVANFWVFSDVVLKPTY